MKNFYKKLCMVLAIFLLFGTGFELVYAEEMSNEAEIVESTENIVLESQEQAIETDGSDAQVLLAEVPAEEETTQIFEKSDVVVNPLYEDVLDKRDVEEEIEAVANQMSGVVVFGTETECQTVNAATSYMRGQMVARENNVSFLIPTSLYSANTLNAIFYDAMEYFASCSGQEGDALAWGWRGMEWNGVLQHIPATRYK